MLAIRMQRNGRTHYPTFRLVVQESQRHPLSGRVVAEVGNYNQKLRKPPSTKKRSSSTSRMVLNHLPV